MDILKGMSINVTLSEEQMNQIAELTFEKVKSIRTYYMDEVSVLQREVQDLRKEIERRDSMIVGELLREESYKDKCDRLRNVIKGLRKEIEELKNHD